MEPNNLGVGVGVVIGVIGTVLPILCNFIIGIFSVKKKADLLVIQTQLEDFRKERHELAQQNHIERVELQKQIFAMREEMVALKNDHLRCTEENASLKAQVFKLTCANNELIARVVELESEVKQLRGN